MRGRVVVEPEDLDVRHLLRGGGGDLLQLPLALADRLLVRVRLGLGAVGAHVAGGRAVFEGRDLIGRGRQAEEGAGMPLADLPGAEGALDAGLSLVSAGPLGVREGARFLIVALAVSPRALERRCLLTSLYEDLPRPRGAPGSAVPMLSLNK